MAKAVKKDKAKSAQSGAKDRSKKDSGQQDRRGANDQGPGKPKDAKGKKSGKDAAKFGQDLAKGASAKAKGKSKEEKKKAKGPEKSVSDGGVDAGGGGKPSGGGGGKPSGGSGKPSGGGGKPSGGSGGKPSSGGPKGGGSGGASAGGGPKGGSGKGKSKAKAGGGGGGGGGAGGAVQGAAGKAARALLSKKPSKFLAGHTSMGKAMSGAKKRDERLAAEGVPKFLATMPGDAAAAAKKAAQKARAEDKVEDGVEGQEPEKLKKGDKKADKAKKQKPASKDKSDLQKFKDALDQIKAIFGRMFSKISAKSDVGTDPGAPPPVEYAGKSDPERAGRQEGDAGGKMDGAHAEFSKAIDDGPGPGDVHRKELEETFTHVQPPDITVPDVATSPEGTEYLKMKLTAEERAKADDTLQKTMGPKLEKEDEGIQKALKEQEDTRQKGIREAEAETEKLNKTAEADQEKQVDKTKKDIDKEQKKTKKKQDAEVKKAKRKGDKERRKVEKDIDKRKKDDDRKIKGKFEGAEKEAEGEKRKAEAKARRKKKAAEAKKKKQSWWDRMKSAIGDFVEACCSAITAIFDALGSLVAGIINAVKDLACAIIDAAVAFAKMALDGLGKLLKGLVSGLIGRIFPELAKKLNNFIDSGINLCKQGIDTIGKGLKAGVKYACDTVNKVAQKALSVVKTGLTTYVRVVGCVVQGDLEGAFLAGFYGALEIAGIPKGTADKIFGTARDTIKKIVDAPGAFIGNLMDAGSLGFSQFADNFEKHFLKQIQAWLLGPVAAAGLKIPSEWDAQGVFEMVLSILGVSKESMKEMLAERIGEDNMEMIEKAWEYVSAFIEGGFQGLWDKIKDQLGGLWDSLLDMVVEYITGEVVEAGAKFLTGLLMGPLGALWRILKTGYDIYCTIRDKLKAIKEIVVAVFKSVKDIATGNIANAANWVEGALANALGIAIDMMANMLGIDDIPDALKGFLTKLQKKVKAAIGKAMDWAIDKTKKLWAKAKKAVKGDDKAEETDGEAKKDGEDEKKKPTLAELPEYYAATPKGSMVLYWKARKSASAAEVHIKGWPDGQAAKELIAIKAKLKDVEDKKKGEALVSKITTAQLQLLNVQGYSYDFLSGDKVEERRKQMRTGMDALGLFTFQAVDYLARSENPSGADLGERIEFTAGGEKHALWVKAEGGKATPMVASSEMTVSERLVSWRSGPLAKMKDAGQKDETKRFGGLIGKGIAIERKIKDLGSKVASGGATAAQVDAKNQELKPVMVELFGNLGLGDSSATGFAAIDPKETLKGKDYKEFKKRFKALAVKVGLSGADKEAQRIWLLAVGALLATDQGYKEAKPDAQNAKYKQLGDESFKKLLSDFDPLVAALQPYMDKWVIGKTQWAFWSGKPALAVASANTQVALETSAFGGLFDGININGDWDTQMWGALSKAYAKSAAKQVEDRTYEGYVGMGSSRDNSIFNQIEQKTFAKMLKDQKKAVPPITWYACAARLTDPSKFDARFTGGGKPGTFAKGNLRAPIVKIAEDRNQARIDAHKAGKDPDAADGGQGDGEAGGEQDKAKVVEENVKKTPAVGFQAATGDAGAKEPHSLSAKAKKGKAELFVSSAPKRIREQIESGEFKGTISNANKAKLWQLVDRAEAALAGADGYRTAKPILKKIKAILMEAGFEYAPPEVGLHPLKGKGADGLSLESHHLPAKKLAWILQREIDDISEALQQTFKEVEELQSDSGAAPQEHRNTVKAIMDWASTAKSRHGGDKGDKLAAILLHRDTHRLGPKAVHKKALIPDIEAKLDDRKGKKFITDYKTAQKKAIRVMAAAGDELSVNPQAKAWERFLADCYQAVLEGEGRAVSKSNRSAEDILDQARDDLEKAEEQGAQAIRQARVRLTKWVVLAYRSALEQGKAAVLAALEQSSVDGPKSSHRAQVGRAESIASRSWGGVVSVGAGMKNADGTNSKALDRLDRELDAMLLGLKLNVTPDKVAEGKEATLTLGGLIFGRSPKIMIARGRKSGPEATILNKGKQSATVKTTELAAGKYNIIVKQAGQPDAVLLNGLVVQAAEEDAEGAGGGGHPKTEAEYGKTVSAKHKSDFKALETIASEFKKNGGLAKRKDATLNLTAADVEKLWEKYKEAEAALEEAAGTERAAAAKENVGNAKATAQAAASARPGAGKNMGQLLARAKELTSGLKTGERAAKDVRDELNGLMNAAMILANQIDPEGSKQGRLLYKRIDEDTHAVFLKAAEAAGVDKAVRSKLASSYRRWLRTYFRTEVMGDQTCAEILFLRDRGISGQRDGPTYEQVKTKTIRKLKDPKKTTQDKLLRADFTFGTAKPEELDRIYDGIIGSAASTNKGVTGSMTADSNKGSGEGTGGDSLALDRNTDSKVDIRGDSKQLPEEKKGKPGKVSELPAEQYKKGDESHTIKHDGKTLNRHSEKQPVKAVIERGEAWTLADKIDKDCKAFLGKDEKRKTEQGTDKLKKTIRADIKRLKALMLQARGLAEELSPGALVKKRDKFENELARRAQGYKWATRAADFMADKAWAIMAVEAKPALLNAEKIDEALIKDEGLMSDPDFQNLVKGTGLSLTSGFAGAVGKSFAKIKKVFQSGNLRTKVQHVVNFGEKWSKRAFEQDAEAVKKILAAVGVKKKELDEFEKLHKMAKAGTIKKDKKGMFGGAGGDQETKDRDKDYKDAKSGSDMDRKFPSLPLATLERDELVHLARMKGLKPRATTPSETIIKRLEKLQKAAQVAEIKKKGESYIDPSSTGLGGPLAMSERDKDDEVVGLSADEKRAKGLKKDLLPFMEGTLANIVDENHWWISEARDLEMPLKAGISGTTSRYMHFAKLMSAPDLYSQRLAVFAWAVPINAHSYHEVMSAAKAYCDYSKGKYLPFRPLNKQILSAAVVASGSEKEEVDQILGIAEKDTKKDS